jgi:hypothetical protein
MVDFTNLLSSLKQPVSLTALLLLSQYKINGT